MHVFFHENNMKKGLIHDKTLTLRPNLKTSTL